MGRFLSAVEAVALVLRVNWIGSTSNSISSGSVCPYVPLCMILKQLLIPARSPALAIYSPGTLLLISSSVLLCEVPVSHSHTVSQVPAAPGVRKVHLIPTKGRKERGIWCWMRMVALGCWVFGTFVDRGVCLGEPLQILGKEL